MGERILLINPIRRRRKPTRSRQTVRVAAPTKRKAPRKRSLKKRAGTMARRRRSAAQRAATRRLVALNRSRRRASNPIRRRRRARRRNPVTKSAAYRSTAAMTGRAANPIRRRRRRRANPIRHHRRRRHYAANPIRYRRRRRRSNPLGLPRGGRIMGLLAPAAVAAAGALILDIIMGYVPLPANFAAGPMKVVAKSGIAVVMSMLAGKVVSQSTARALGVGALTVVFHDVAKQLVASVAPSLKMDGIGYYSAGYPAGGYMDGVGVYVGAQGTARSGLPMAGMSEYVHGMGRFDSEQGFYNY